MAEVFDSELNAVVQEPSSTVPEPLITNTQSDTVSKNPNCNLLQEDEEEVEKNPLKGSVLEKRLKGVCENSEMAKKKEDVVDFCGDDCDGSVKCALKIEVIDDTALIGPAKLPEVFQRNGNNKRNVVQGSDGNGKRIAGFDGNLEKNGNGRGNLMQESDGNGKRIASFNGNLLRNENEFGKGVVNVIQESERKKEKRPRRRGKKNDGMKKGDEKENMSTSTNVGADSVQVSTVSREGKISYSRKEMEALRFVDMEEQKNKWVEVYCGMGPEIAKEYDGLVDSDNQKQMNIQVDFDPRRQFGYRRPPSVIGDSSSVNADIRDEYSCPVADEECSNDDYSEEEEYESILRPAFAVAGEPDFDSGPPQDGLEYLRRVRWEASRIPKVKVSKVDKSKLNREQTAYMPQIPDIAKCPEHLLPLKQWEDAFLADFSKLRLALSRHEGSTEKLPSKQPIISVTHKLSDAIVIESFDELTAKEDSLESSDISMDDNSNQQTVSAIGENDPSDSLESSNHEEPLKENPGNYPTLSMILEMDSVARVSKLRKRISSLENVSSISKDDCLWLFALCAAVDTPLDADTSASFRSLLRKCASLRAQKTEMDDEVIMLNILATISGRYFGQSEN